MLNKLFLNLTPLGLTGSPAFLEYAYVYNLTDQTIPIEADVPFDSNGILTAGFLHNLSAPNITILETGIYKVEFSISGTEPNQFAFFLTEIEVSGTVYGSGAGTEQNNGQAIFMINAGDELTLRNHSSAVVARAFKCN